MSFVSCVQRVKVTSYGFPKRNLPDYFLAVTSLESLPRNILAHHPPKIDKLSFDSLVSASVFPKMSDYSFNACSLRLRLQIQDLTGDLHNNAFSAPVSECLNRETLTFLLREILSRFPSSVELATVAVVLR